MTPSEPENPLILVIEDYRVDREDIKQTFAGTPYTLVFAEDREDALNKLTEEVRSVILDLGLPPRPLQPDVGLELLKEIRKARPDIPIVVYSGQSFDALTVRDMLLAKASYIEKRSDALTNSQELVELFKWVMKDVVIFTRGPAVFLQNVASRAYEQENPLTDRQWETLQLLCEDKSSAQISEMLNIAKETVLTHKKNILDELEKRGEISSRSQLALCNWFKENFRRYGR